MDNNSLIVAGHFAVGFIFGYIGMNYLFKAYPDKLNVQLYAPFLPFILGLWAAIPHPFVSGSQDLPAWLHLFVFYPFIHHDELFIILLGRSAFVAVLCGTLYIFIIYRYIKLAKITRKYGWSDRAQFYDEKEINLAQGPYNAR